MRKCIGICTVPIAGVIMLALTGCGGDDAPRSAGTASAKGQSDSIPSVDRADKTITNPIGMKLMRIPAGEFHPCMGKWGSFVISLRSINCHKRRIGSTSI